MKTLKDIIALRSSKYVDDAKNSSYTEFWQGYFEGWADAYQDLKEILEQNKFNLDALVIGDGKTNADHIRSMTDEELAKRLIVLQQSAICYASIKLVYTPPSPEIISVEDFKSVLDWLKQPYKENT